MDERPIMTQTAPSGRDWIIHPTAIIAPSAVIECSFLRVGADCRIEEHCVLRADEIVVGDGVLIDRHVTMDGTRARRRNEPTKIEIGDFSTISYESRVFSPSFHMGDYCMLYNHSLVYGKNVIRIGHNCWIGENTILNSEGRLIIGNNVGIGTYSQVWTHGYWGDALEGCLLNNEAPTVLHDDSWLIGHVIVSPGVDIGRKAIVLTGSVVTKDLAPGTVWGGSPAKDLSDKIPGWREVDSAERLELMKRFIGEFLEERYRRARVVRDGEDYIVETSDGYEFEIRFVDTLAGEPTRCGTRDAILIAATCTADPTLWPSCVLDLTRRIYSKRKMRVERELLLFLRSYRARFLPIDDEGRPGG